MSVVYDAGVLVAADRNHRAIWADHRIRLEIGAVPVTTAPVVAQVSRSSLQVQLRRFLRGCEIEPFLAEDADAVGRLLGDAGASDVVHAHVVLVAASLGTGVVTGDVKALSQLAARRRP